MQDANVKTIRTARLSHQNITPDQRWSRGSDHPRLRVGWDESWTGKGRTTVV